jgi:hypothetical protein
MRLVPQVPSPLAAHKADIAFEQDESVRHLIGEQPMRAKMGCEFGAARKVWMDEYVRHGGDHFNICGERVATLRSDHVVAQVADRVFFARHPELKSRWLNFDHADGSLRSEWMDLYVEYGGRVTEICTDHKCA